MRTILLACLLAACGSAAPPPPAPVAAKPTPPAAPVAAKPRFPGAPATPAGDQLAWVLDAIVTHHGKVGQPELKEHFHPSFLAQVPLDQAAKIFEELGKQLTQLTITSVEGDDLQLRAHATVGGQKLVIQLALDPASKQMSGLLLQPEVESGPRPQSFDEVERMIADLAPKAQMLVAELDHGACKPLQELASTDELAIGSTFKLYVLLALADRVAAGKAAWTDELAVRDDWKSLPSGVTQNEAPGTKHPLATFAERMISISDNTAADHLLYTLSRKAVEATLRETAHARPALDEPFPSTRELFVLKLVTPPAEVDRYLKLPEAKRRDYLDKTLAGKDANLGIGVDWKTARRVSTVEWFASSVDLCHAMAALWTRGQDPKTAQVLDILARNPGMAFDKDRWPYIGFKGGSEPGVLNLTYLLKRNDDKWFVVTLGFNAAEGAALDSAKIINAMTGVIELLGAH